MSAWWWAAVVVLVAGACGLACYELGPDWPRKDDDDGDYLAGGDTVAGPGLARPAPAGAEDDLRLSVEAGPAYTLHPAAGLDDRRGGADREVRASAGIPDLTEPTDGDAYAAELHAIAQAADADQWDPVASLRQMCPYVRSMGFTPEDWHDRLMGMAHADYMAELDRAHRARLERWGAEQAAWKARQLRGIRRYRGLGAAA